MKQISQQSQTNPGGAFWHTRDGLIYIGPRQISAAGRWREIIASATVLAALAMMAVGLLAPQRLGLANNRIVYVAGPALVLAALIHLFLVISAVRGAWAVAGAGGLKLDGRKLSWSQVQRPRLEKSQGAGVIQTALVVDVTWKIGRDQPTETIPLVPAGMTDEADLQRLLAEIRNFMAPVGVGLRG